MLGLRRERVENAALKERVATLQAAIAVCCTGAARRWSGMRLGPMTAITAAVLALGFVLGVNSGPLKQAGADLLSALGVARPAPDIDAAHVAYQKADYATALSLARPLAEYGDARAQSLLGLVRRQHS